MLTSRKKSSWRQNTGNRPGVKGRRMAGRLIRDLVL
jgi:hypothetical protein